MHCLISYQQRNSLQVTIFLNSSSCSYFDTQITSKQIPSIIKLIFLQYLQFSIDCQLLRLSALTRIYASFVYGESIDILFIFSEILCNCLGSANNSSSQPDFNFFNSSMLFLDQSRMFIAHLMRSKRLLYYYSVILGEIL
jgi:hypothetical protein